MTLNIYLNNLQYIKIHVSTTTEVTYNTQM